MEAVALLIGEDGPELVRVIERADGVLVRVRDHEEVELLDLVVLLGEPRMLAAVA